jgi:hypothetical protein
MERSGGTHRHNGLSLPLQNVINRKKLLTYGHNVAVTSGPRQPCRTVWGKFAVDSPQEGDGFELPVPRGKKSVSHWIR